MKNKNYEIIYSNFESDGRSEIITDRTVLEKIIFDLETFERMDINRIDLVDDNGEFIDSIWTEEEGIVGDY